MSVTQKSAHTLPPPGKRSIRGVREKAPVLSARASEHLKHRYATDCAVAAERDRERSTSRMVAGGGDRGAPFAISFCARVDAARFLCAHAVPGERFATTRSEYCARKRKVKLGWDANHGYT